MSKILKGLNESRNYGRDSWDSNMPGYQGDYGGVENFGRKKRDWDENDTIDARLRQQHAQRQEYEKSGKFWLKLKDTQRHLPAGPFIGKQAANVAAIDLLKKQPELKGNLLITAYGPDEKLNELSPETLASYKKKAGQQASELDKAAFSGDSDAKKKIAKANKRFSGIVKATKKEFEQDKKEIDEVQLKTMRKYFAGDKNAQDELKITQMRQYFDELRKKEEQERKRKQELQKVAKMGSGIKQGVTEATEAISEEQLEENLRKWFKEKWVRFGPDGKIRGDCARGDDSEGKPKCLPQAKAHALGKKGRKYAASKKRREDPNPERRGPAKNVATKKKSNEGVTETVHPDITSKKYFIDPTKNVKMGDFEFNARTFTGGLADPNARGLQIRAYDPSRPKGSGSIGSADFIVKSDKKGNQWLESDDTDVDDEYRGKGVATMMYAFAKSLGNDIKDSPYKSKAGADMWSKWGSDAKHLVGEQGVAEAELDEACWKGYHKEGNKKMFGKTYPNCVKNTNEEQEIEEGWKDVVAGSALALSTLGAGAQTMPNINVQQVELANKYYNVLVQRAKEDGRELDTRTLNMLKAKAQDAAAKKLQQSTPQQSFPTQGNERRVAKDANQFEAHHSESCPHCGGEMVSEELMNEKKDACYYKVKSRYKVWPSAYASGALVKCRKKGAANWGNKSESVAEAIRNTAEFGSRYAEQLAQKVFDQNSNLDTSGRATELLNAGYAIARAELGKIASGIFRDEDFPSDFVSSYNWLKKQGVAETKVSKYKDLGATKSTTHFIKNVTTGKIVSPHRSRQDAEDALVASMRDSNDEFKIVRARKEGVAEGLNEAVDSNYLYHSTETADTAKKILSSGVFKAGNSNQDVTNAQVGNLPTVSFGRNIAYQLSGENVNRDYEVVFVVDRSKLEQRYKTFGTSQSRENRGLAFPKPENLKAGEIARSYDVDKSGNLDKRDADEIHARGTIQSFGKPAPRDMVGQFVGRAKQQFYAPKSGGEFEEVVPTKTGMIPWKGMLVGFYLVPGKAASRDPELLNHPLRLDMPRPNQFVKAKQQQGVAEGLDQITEYRDRLLQYVKSLLPAWPEYVLKDWLVPNKGDFSNLPDTELKNGIMEKLKLVGLTPNSKWQLVPNMKFTMNMFDPKTKQQLIGRAGGKSDLGMQIPKDAERHATQAQLAQQQGGVRKEPVLLIKTANGYELLEGWHRTIQHFHMYPNGYTGPAYVAVAQGQQGVAEEQLDEKWTKKYKDSINCSNPKGFSQKAHCAGKKKNESFVKESAIMKGLK